MGGNLRNASSKNDGNEAFAPSKERFHSYLSGSYVFRGLFCSYNVFAELAARKKHFNATQIRTPASQVPYISSSDGSTPRISSGCMLPADGQVEGQLRTPRSHRVPYAPGVMNRAMMYRGG